MADAQSTDTSDMFAVHAALRTSLAAASAYIASTTGDEARRAMIANYYDNVLSFLAVHHDGEESIVFPRLVERAPDHRSVVDAAVGDHEEVLGLLDAARAGVADWQQAGDAAAASLVDLLGALGDGLGPHLEREEAEVLPLAAAHMSPEEWGSLPGYSMANFGGDKVWLILGLIREQMTEEQRAMMLAHMPPPALAMWEGMGEASFNELIAAVRAGS